MPPKRKSDGGSEQKAKKHASAAAVPSSAAARAAQAASLIEQTQLQYQQAAECSRLASLLRIEDARPLDVRAAAVVKMLQEDEKRKQTLLDLSYELDVSHWHTRIAWRVNSCCDDSLICSSCFSVAVWRLAPQCFHPLHGQLLLD